MTNHIHKGIAPSASESLRYKNGMSYEAVQAIIKAACARDEIVKKLAKQLKEIHEKHLGKNAKRNDKQLQRVGVVTNGVERQAR